MQDPPLLYKKLFAPKHVHYPSKHIDQPGDQRRNPIYVYTEEIILAVNVALATQRPLLVRGPSGSGKSSLASSVADVLGWRYYEEVITSRSQARDLLWEVDLLRRLHKAQAGQGDLGSDYTPYIIPGKLWWAFDRNSARYRGAKPQKQEQTPPLDDPCLNIDHPRAVVLIDEIDKADPDVPNNLLVPLGSLQFQVEETGAIITTDAKDAPLVFITTNEERELPVAFLRRCVEVKLNLPDKTRLIEIGQAHFPSMKKGELEKILKALFGPDQGDDSEEARISPAEFIDTVRAWKDLEMEINSPAWEALTSITIWKHGRTRKNKQ